LTNLKDDMWNEEHDELIKEFLIRSDKTVLIFYIDKNNSTQKLVAQDSMLKYKTDQFSYFLKSYQAEDVSSKELFNNHVHFGTFNENNLFSLLRLCSGLYAPLFFGNKTWPDSKFAIIKNYLPLAAKYSFSISQFTFK
jgi:dynein heavy chain, axonemal